MAFNHQTLEWPRFSWNIEALAGLLAAVRHRQGRVLGRMESLGFELQAEASLQTLTGDVENTSAIEGEVLQPDQVRSFLARRLGIDIGGYFPAGRDVEGIVEVLIDATQKYDEALTAERLFGWHAALFPTGRSGMRRITVGAWRPGCGPDASRLRACWPRARSFEAPSAERLELEMTRFLDWFNAPLQTDPVVKAALAHFWFVTIHPFEDGNGRIARAIADMALARADGTAKRLYSMSSQLEAERRDYCDQLEAQQRGSVDLTVWPDWFLGGLDRALGRAEEMLAVVLFEAKL